MLPKRCILCTCRQPHVQSTYSPADMEWTSSQSSKISGHAWPESTSTGLTVQGREFASNRKQRNPHKSTAPSPKRSPISLARRQSNPVNSEQYPSRKYLWPGNSGGHERLLPSRPGFLAASSTLPNQMHNGRSEESKLPRLSQPMFSAVQPRLHILPDRAASLLQGLGRFPGRTVSSASTQAAARLAEHSPMLASYLRNARELARERSQSPTDNGHIPRDQQACSRPTSPALLQSAATAMQETLALPAVHGTLPVVHRSLCPSGTVPAVSPNTTRWPQAERSALDDRDAAASDWGRAPSVASTATMRSRARHCRGVGYAQMHLDCLAERWDGPSRMLMIFAALTPLISDWKQ